MEARHRRHKKAGNINRREPTVKRNQSLQPGLCCIVDIDRLELLGSRKLCASGHYAYVSLPTMRSDGDVGGTSLNPPLEVPSAQRKSLSRPQ